MKRLTSAIFLAIALAAVSASAQVNPTPVPPAPTTPIPSAPIPTAIPAARGTNLLSLTASFGANSAPLRTGIAWRVFSDHPGANGSYPLVAQTDDASPTLPLADGNYVVHAAYGLAGATKWIVMNGQPASENVVLNAGALRITSMLGDTKISAARLLISIYVAEPGNSEAKLVVPNAKPGTLLGLPEGSYHIVSTYLDSAPSGTTTAASATPANATNSVVNADIKVQPGKLTDTVLAPPCSDDHFETREHGGG